MEKNDFWTVDKLMPKLRQSLSPKEKGGKHFPSLPLSELQNDDLPKIELKRIYRSDSRVIRSYRIFRYEENEQDKAKNKAIFFQLEEGKIEKSMQYAPLDLTSVCFSKLNAEQLSFFSYFCACIRERKKLDLARFPLDFPYLILYSSRLAHLAILGKGDLEKELSDLIWVWESYRDHFSLIDKFFSDFLFDFALLAECEIPFELLSPILTSASLPVRSFIYNLFTFDYLFSEKHRLSSKEMRFLLDSINRCAYSKTKAYRSNRGYASLLEKALFSAISDGLFNDRTRNDTLFNIQIPSEVKTTRRLFPDLEIDRSLHRYVSLIYVPVLYDENIRSRFDDIIRYTEGRVRQNFGIKNNLSRIHIPQIHQLFLEGYFKDSEGMKAESLQAFPKKEEAERPQERKLEIDIEKAQMIESDSWEITKELTQPFLDNESDFVSLGESASEIGEEYQNELDSISAKPNVGENEFWEFAAALSEEEDTFMRILCHTDAQSARSFVFSKGLFFDSMLFSCNAKAQEMIGDIIFDPSGKLFEDYKKDLADVFPPLKGEENE